MMGCRILGYLKKLDFTYWAVNFTSVITYNSSEFVLFILMMTVTAWTHGD